MRFLVFLLVLALLAASATYAVLNLEERVDVHLPWITLRGQPQIFLVLAALATGALFTGLIALMDGTRLRLAIHRLRRELKALRSIGGAFPLEVPAEDLGHRGTPSVTPRSAAGTRPAERPLIPDSAGGRAGDDETPYGI